MKQKEGCIYMICNRSV